jgi:predicted aspartyl protease/Tfp pilus assembly protein PilF
MRRLNRVLLLLCLFWILAPSAAHAQDSPPANAAAPSAPAAASPSIADAQHLYRTGKLDAAIQEYALLENGPQAALAYVGLERVYLKQKKTAEAYAAVAKAVELAPDSADTKVVLGETLYRQGKIPEAEVQFVHVINSGANNARAYLGLAHLSAAISLYHREKQMIDRAHELDPADPDITRFWLSTLTLGDRIRALHDDVVKDTNDDPETQHSLDLQLTRLQSQPTVPIHPCRMTSKIDSTEADLTQMMIDARTVRGFGLHVKLNGTSSRLLLDTGAEGILVDQKLAAKAGIKKIAGNDIRGLGDNGPAQGYIGYADSIQIGDIEFQDCRVEVIERNSAAGEDGLIGADVFAHFLVDMDFPDGKFRLSELPPRPDEAPTPAALDAGSAPAASFQDRYIAPEMKSYSRVLRFGHMLLVPTTVNDSVSTLFLMDTGAATNAISPDAAREVTKVWQDEHLTISGLNGNVKKAFVADSVSLTFGNLKEPKQGVIAFDFKSTSDSIGTEVSGTLGFAMLDLLDIKIDYRDGLVKFAFDPKHY